MRPEKHDDETRADRGRERVRKILPERQIVRFFQVEHKLDAIVNAELAERVPLVE